jgi:hypothetical protein
MTWLGIPSRNPEDAFVIELTRFENASEGRLQPLTFDKSPASTRMNR